MKLVLLIFSLFSISACTKAKSKSILITPPKAIVHQLAAQAPAPTPATTAEVRKATVVELKTIKLNLCYDPSNYRCFRYLVADTARSDNNQTTELLCIKGSGDKFCAQFMTTLVAKGTPDSGDINPNEFICRYNSPTGDEYQFNANNDQIALKGIVDKCIKNAQANSR